MSVTLRPYQERFIADLRQAYLGGAKSVLGVMPTGAGKTVCFSHMAQAASEKRLRVGILAHRTELLDQISGALDAVNVRHGFVAPGRGMDPFAYVQVCSVFAVARRIERYIARPFDFLIVDEAHHAASGSSWAKVIAAHAGRRILGVTATPQRLSGEPLSAAFGQMVMGPSVAELVDLGALSPYRAFAPSSPDLAGVGRRMGDYVRPEIDAAMDKPTITGDAVSTYLRLARGKRALAFCVSIAHAEHVAADFRASGVAAASLDGKMDRARRREVIRDFTAGRLHVVTSCDLVSEGFDLPAIEAAILLRPTQSLALHLQQIGRALRPFPGKAHALILDHAGNLMRHGLPDDDREWSLEGRRKGPSKPGESALAVTTCASCFGVFRPAPVCPHCGVAGVVEGRRVDEVDGELDEVDVEALRRARKVEVARARDIPSLVAVARERGHRKGWIAHMLLARGERVDWRAIERAWVT